MFSVGLLGSPDTQWAAVKTHLWGEMIILVIVVIMMVIMLMMVIALMMVIMVMIMIMIMIHIEDQDLQL